MANSPLQFLLFDDAAPVELIERRALPAAEAAVAVVANDPTAGADPGVEASGIGTPSESLPTLEDLHPALWRAHQLGRQRQGSTASGFAALDLVLPGQGWPHRALTELLLPHPGVGELRLLAPALAALQRQSARPLMLFDPPALPSAAACQALGLNLHQLLLVRSRPPRPGAGLPHPRLRQRLPAAADLLWTLEQTLASGHAGAVLAWLPATLGMEALRRLQLAAQAHDGPAFMLRDAGARQRASVAPLRIELTPAMPDALLLRLLKRRGPPLLQPLRVELAPVLTASARERSRRTRAPGVAVASVATSGAAATRPVPSPLRPSA